MKTKVDYEKAWKKFRRWMREDFCWASGYEKKRVQAKGTKILKQCTKQEIKDKKPKYLTFDEEADLKREQVDFSDPNF